MNKGRRRGSPDTREAILRAARGQFAAKGYDATTMRAVAREAGVDVALVSYFFGPKADLFVAALQLRVSPAAAIDAVLADGGRDDVGRRLLLMLLSVWDDPVSGGPLLSLLRSVSDDASAQLLRGFLERELIGRLVTVLDDSADADTRADGARPADAQLRAAAAASQVLGLVHARYVLRLEPLASASHDELAALIGPTLQRYLTD